MGDTAGRVLRSKTPALLFGRGFTLIEIMVVLLVIGMVVGIALVAPRVSGPGQALQNEVSRLRVLIEQARERALMEDRELGLSLTGQNGYRWWGWSREQGAWQELEERSLRSYKLPDDMFIVDLSDSSGNSARLQPLEEDGNKPTWIMYADTRVTPLRLELFQGGDQQRKAILESDGIGPVISP